MLTPSRLRVVSMGVAAAGAAGIAWHYGGRASLAALAIAMVPAVYFSPALERRLCQRRLRWLLIIVGSASVAYALLGDTLRAGWSPIDDHEIMAFLGQDGRVSLHEIPALLMQTEVGQPGGGQPRYRPSYYSVRLLETMMWGASPRAWYASHLVMFTATVALAWRFFARWVGLVPAAVLVLYMLTYPFWGDIFARLGPGEVYGALGTALFLEGMALVVPLRVGGRGSPRGGWAMLGVGAWLAMGSKEIFLIMLVPLWGLVAWRWRRGGLGRAGATTAVLVTAYGGLIILAVSVSILFTGMDVYKQPVTSAGRLALVWPGLQRAMAPLTVWHAALTLVLAAVLALAAASCRARWLGRLMLKGTLLAGGLVMLYVSQFVFYNGAWPQAPGAPRYDFPGVLSRPLLVVTGVVFGLALLRRLRVPRPPVRALAAGLVAVLLVLTVQAGWGPLIRSSVAHASSTRAWTERLDRVVARLRDEPTRPVVVVSHDLGDYEPIFAIPSFLTAKAVANPLFLETPAYRTDSALTEVLARQLLDLSRHGLAGYRPLDRLPLTPPPLAISLSGVPPAPYEDLGSLWPMPPAGSR